VVDRNKINFAVDCSVAVECTLAPLYGPPDTPGFPKIKATGIEVLNDPETFELTIEGGKLTTFKVLASGEKTGLCLACIIKLV
jgi:hypothetical protein